MLETVPVRDIEPPRRVVSRLKIMVGLIIAKSASSRRRIAMKNGEEEYFLRVFVRATKYGEACVCAIRKAQHFLDLEVGHGADPGGRLSKMVRLPQGWCC
jgi:type II secretory ATPase GspE/PulE/Tfp pilus assembly ATPase PilB-like protein